MFLVGCSTIELPQENVVESIPAERRLQPVAGEEPDPLVVPSGSANENLDAFKFHLQRSGAGKPEPLVAEIMSALVRAGFDPAMISHTAVETRTGLLPESITVAIEIQDECLLGQFGASWLEVVVAPKVGNVCIIGESVRLEAE